MVGSVAVGFYTLAQRCYNVRSHFGNYFQGALLVIDSFTKRALRFLRISTSRRRDTSTRSIIGILFSSNIWRWSLQYCGSIFVYITSQPESYQGTRTVDTVEDHPCVKFF
ncbi:uncharacterized protein LOC125376845 [Haliotis rufescens]|uniref:uncharacterized protein LOC125376845 n=1 Tax=Haliotis rufescens TaxID=6454 RepID=UPI00201EC2BC|nr:uncharacterized protein LOC125376845 [Haliotis rufescens]